MRIINKKRLGSYGEIIAEEYLKKIGYEIIEKNFYTRRGEIDIVAKIDRTLIFVEVKTRTNLNFGTPAMAVNKTKIRKMKFAANIFLMLHNFKEYSIRFDVIEVFILNDEFKINHIKQII